MRHEGHWRRKAQLAEGLLDFGCMAVRLDLVGERVLGERDVVHLVPAAAARAGDALHGVDDDVRDQSLLGERREREHRGGRVAAGVGDKVRAADSVAVQFGQAVGGVVDELGVRVLAVPLLVGLEVAQAEVGGQVDDLEARGAHLRHDRRRGGVRVGDDRGVEPLRPRPCRAR